MNNNQILELEFLLKNLLYLEDDNKTFALFAEGLNIFSKDPLVIKAAQKILERVNSGDQKIFEMETADYVKTLSL